MTNKCSGKRCPMQDGFKVEECKLGKKCEYFHDSFYEFFGWWSEGYKLVNKYHIDKDILANSFSIWCELTEKYEKGAKKNETE